MNDPKKPNNEEEIKEHVKKRTQDEYRLTTDKQVGLSSHEHKPIDGLIQEYNYTDLKFDDPSRLECRFINDFAIPPGYTLITLEYNPKLSSLATFLNTFLKYNNVSLVQKAMKEYNEMIDEDPNDITDEKLIKTIYENLESSIKVLNQIKSSLEPFRNHHNQLVY